MENVVTFNVLNSEKRTEVWQYRGEGNANLVLSLPDVKKVIRIRKRPRHVSTELVVDREIKNIEFYDTVAKKLFNPFVGGVDFIEIEKEEIDKLNYKINKFRAAYRCSKKLDYNGSCLLDDYCLMPTFLEPFITGDTFSIEIKPKQGFINEFCQIKCFYCQNQYLKVAQGKISHGSEYCPLNLFSGNKERIKYSIKQLVRNPQNNFRLFKNGNIIYDDNRLQQDFYAALKDLFSINKNTNDDFCEFMHQVLTRNFSVTSPDIFCATCCFSKKTNILQTLLSVQQLDKHQNLTACNLNCNDWNYVNIIIDEVTEKKNCILCALRSYWTMESNTEQYLIPYLISAVAKDCSVMIAFAKANERIATPAQDIGDNLIHLESGSLVFSINLMDLYPKPFATIQKHISRDAELSKFNDKVIHKHTEL